MERSSTRVTERPIKKFLGKPDTVPGRFERSAPGGEASNNSHRQKVTDDNRTKEVFCANSLSKMLCINHFSLVLAATSSFTNAVTRGVHLTLKTNKFVIINVSRNGFLHSGVLCLNESRAFSAFVIKISKIVLHVKKN
ncbi:hypothetical protein MTP99_018247 [Tenebrio molitor]|nr:hypothetical protein MTP99_018247 [Tenebrio molitor]